MCCNIYSEKAVEQNQLELMKEEIAMKQSTNQLEMGMLVCKHCGDMIGLQDTERAKVFHACNRLFPLRLGLARH